ncbi:hypothetical protein PV327_008584 [Microctonus hyperodae]|uniref:Ig-like domain-containing protein n=1 Tax=Microctonus hyperodae TaxID=165561 RepID=A0AA39F3G1_MICHY|nr:hypothetical protein PV327_008584 [Microctonus hyperodae]
MIEQIDVEDKVKTKIQLASRIYSTSGNQIPPSIAPFSFNKDLSEGVRAQVACVIEKGDPPFTLIWSKDGEPIATSTPSGFGSASTTTAHKTNSPNTIAGLRVTSMDVHSSTIAIDRVTAAHAGNYTCVARNSVAEVSSTAQLVVRGKVIFTESSIFKQINEIK